MAESSLPHQALLLNRHLEKFESLGPVLEKIRSLLKVDFVDYPEPVFDCYTHLLDSFKSLNTLHRFVQNQKGAVADHENQATQASV